MVLAKDVIDGIYERAIDVDDFEAGMKYFVVSETIHCEKQGGVNYSGLVSRQCV